MPAIAATLMLKAPTFGRPIVGLSVIRRKIPEELNVKVIRKIFKKDYTRISES